MHTGGFWVLGELSDEALELSLSALIRAGSQKEARVVAHLAEVEARQLHLFQGYDSLFEYCKKALGLSGNEAFYRIAAARMASRYPVIFGLLERRELFITTLPSLHDYITPENHGELLEAVRGKSKAQVLELLATRAPRPDAKSHIRRLPTTPRSVSAGPTATLEPLSAVSYRLQLNVSHALKEKLELARDLMSHANPTGDLAVVVERALEVLIAKLKARRFGMTSRPRKSRPAADHFERSKSTPAHAGERAHAPSPSGPSPSGPSPSGPSPSGPSPSGPSPSGPSPSGPKKWRPHIPYYVRREVVARDGLQCAFTTPEGQRCQARAFLEFDHELALALGGLDSIENLRLFCTRHNMLHAEQDFGAEMIQEAIKRHRRSA